MRKIMSGILLFGLILFIFIPSQTNAEGGLHLQAEIGIDNRVKYDTPTVLTITVTNNGEPFSGDFVVDSKVNYVIGSGIVVPLDIATGETKTIPIYLKGFNTDVMNNYSSTATEIFSFYEGGIEKGKKVQYEGTKFVTPRMMSGKIAIVVTTRKDDVRAFEDLRKHIGDELYTYYASTKNDRYLATDANGLAGVDIMVFDDVALNDLSKEQQEAIYQWVQQGGTIAFAPTLNASLSAGIFKEDLPLSYKDETRIVPKEALKSFLNVDATKEEITVLDAELTDNSWPSLQVDGYLLAGRKSIGRGNVVQLTYALYDPVITKFNNYGLLLKNSLNINSPNYNYFPMTPMNYASDWKYINELFETFKLNVGGLIGGIFIYIILIGPVLYFILKRKDRRGKMWMIIPILAVTTSLLIFIIGAKDRLLSPQVQSMTLYEVGEEGTLNGIFNYAVLSNRSGEFKLEMDYNTYALSASADGSDATNLHKKTYLIDTANGKELTLRNFNYWSIQTVVGETMIPEGGQLISDLKLQDGKLTGTVKSTLPVDLKEVKILSGSAEYDIGSVKAGETADINIETKKTILVAPMNHYGGYGYNQTNFDIQQEQLRLLKEAAINRMSVNNMPLLVGWSDIAITPISLKGGSKQNSVNYFVKPVMIETVIDKEVTFSTDDFVLTLIPDDMNSWGYIENEISLKAYLSEGIFPLHYELKHTDMKDNVKWTTIEGKYDVEQYSLSIVNHLTGETIPFENGEFKITENVTEFIGENQKIEFIIERSIYYGDGLVTLPNITLKGEPQK